jgi:predicted DNA-binding transcriptional regulator YafY
MYALVEELRAIAPRARSSSWLARRFEVSTRTIERDLAALLQAGVPIWATNGRRGGYSLDTRMTLPPLNFTPSEAAAIAVAMAVAGPTPLGEAAHTGLAKIVAAMSPSARRGAAELVRRIRVPEQPPTMPADRISSTVVGALAGRRLLEIAYVDRSGVGTSRLIEPAGLLAIDPHWYLAAWCRLRTGNRAFRLDRIRLATPLLETAPDRADAGWECDVPVPLRPLAIEA